MALDRTTLTLVLGFLGVLVVGALRPQGPDGVWDRTHPKRLWVRKVAWEPDYDLVFAGDSRVAFGVAPKVISDSVPGRRIANFGFLGCGYEESYLGAIDGVVDPDAQDAVIVLGFSPRSVVPQETWTNEYTEARDLSIDKRLALDWLAEPLWDYRRMDLEEVEGWFGPAPAPPKVTYTLHEDGFVETHVHDPRAISKEDRLAPLEGVVDPYPPTAIKAVARAVQAWTDRGIRVYGYRNPSPEERARNEDEHYRFDQDALSAAFEAAGGTWWDLPSEGLAYWDSSHMDGESAREFSARLGARLAQPD